MFAFAPPGGREVNLRRLIGLAMLEGETTVSCSAYKVHHPVTVLGKKDLDFPHVDALAGQGGKGR